MIPQTPKYIGLLGFGEAGQAIAKGLGADKGAESGIQINTYDIKSEHANTGEEIAENCNALGVAQCGSHEEFCERSQIIFSLVTADQAHIAAQSIAKTFSADTLYLDCNSCAPDTKRKSALLIESAGGRYVDVAIMAPIYPKLHKSLMLVCGAHAKEACSAMQLIGMEPENISGQTGDAASTKMIRSIMIKGMEALIAECLLAGKKAGVDERVLASLEKSYPAFNWIENSNYMLERMAKHGLRRAAEMREAALTVEQLGLDNFMSEAIVNWQQTIGEMQLGSSNDPGELADKIIIKLNSDAH